MVADKKMVVRGSTGRVLGLIVGDLIMFGLFVALGRRSHNESVSVGEIVTVAAPFAIGWVAVAPWCKLFRPEIYGNPKLALQRTALAWTLAAPLGLALRTVVWGREFKPAFAITTYIFNLLLLLVWRGWAARKMRKIG